MPLEWAVVEVPPSTSEQTPVQQNMVGRLDRISRFIVIIPQNAANLVGVRIVAAGGPIAPSGGGLSEWIFGDDLNLVWDDEIILEGPPYTVTVEAYSEDDTFTRTVQVGMVFTPSEESLNFLMRRLVNVVEGAVAAIAKTPPLSKIFGG